MRKNDQQSSNGNGKSTQTVRVEFVHPTASTVAIAGTFNDWRPEATRMVSVGPGRWVKVLTLRPGAYEYLLVADGHWLPDPSAGESVTNPFGGINSVLRVPENPSDEN